MTASGPDLPIAAGLAKGLISAIRTPLLSAQGALFLFVPVFLGIGIGLWFSLPFEPGLRSYLVTALVIAALGGVAVFTTELPRLLAIAGFCVALGFCAAGTRAHHVAAPVLKEDYYGPVQGRIIEIDRSASDALRLTLDQVWLSKVAPEDTPRKVRISFQGIDPQVWPGSTILVTARLSAPPGPVEPGGFNFRRLAWFRGLGALGYTHVPPMLWDPPQGYHAWIGGMRMHLSLAIKDAIGGDAGAFAAGALTGDRSGISQETVEDLRDSSLAHLLAISGMNLALIAGFVFFLVRGGLALIPFVVLRVNSKKIAAVLAFPIAAFYLALSGGNIATTRAFLMISVVFLAIILDRRALSLRSVALAAVPMLLVWPESLLDPGFQLSFAATIALIAGFRWLDLQTFHQKFPRWTVPVYTLVLSSLIAGAATGPLAAAHFNRFTDYGLWANLLTVPVMSVLMSAGVLAVLLAPLGLQGIALWVIGLSAEWILWIASEVSDIDGAVTAIAAPHPYVLPAFALGALWWLIWPGRLRWIGVPVLAMILPLWHSAPRPDLLIGESGALVGVLGAEGRALSRSRGEGFSAESWLEDDGDLVSQVIAANRPGFEKQGRFLLFTLANKTGIVATGKSAMAQIDRHCAAHDIVITDQIAAPLDGACLLLDKSKLEQTGPIAVFLSGTKVSFVPAEQIHRLWDDQTHAPVAPWILN